MLPNALKESMAGAGVDDDDEATSPQDRPEDRIDGTDTDGADIGNDGVMSDSLQEPEDTAVSTLADESALASEFPNDNDGLTRWDDDATDSAGGDIESAADKTADEDSDTSKTSKPGRLPIAASILYLLGIGGGLGYLAFLVEPPAPPPPIDVTMTVEITGDVQVAVVDPDPITEPVIAVVDPEPVPDPSPEPTPDPGVTDPPPVEQPPEPATVATAPETTIRAVDRPEGTPPNEPVISLQEPSEFGPLPIIAPDGQRSARFYARQVVGLDVPRIAIVMTDLGLDEERTGEAINTLPADISLAFHPYAPDVNDLIATARVDGHESLLALPMEPLGYPLDDPGPNPLLVDVTPQDNRGALYRSLGSAEGYVGITGFMGSALLENERALSPIMSEIADRGLIFIDNNAALNSVSEQVALRLPMQYGRSSRLIDAIPTAADIDEQLQGLEALAKINGFAIGFAQPFPVTLQRLEEWLPQLRSRGIDLVPVSAVAKRPLGSGS